MRGDESVWQPAVRERRVEQAFAQNTLHAQAAGGHREDTGGEGHFDRSTGLTAGSTSGGVGHVCEMVDHTGGDRAHSPDVITV